MESSITDHLSTVRRTHANDLVGGPRAVAAQKSQWPPRALEAGSEWPGRSYARRCVYQYEVVKLRANSMMAASTIPERYTQQVSRTGEKDMHTYQEHTSRPSSASRHSEAMSQPVVDDVQDVGAIWRKRLVQRLV